MAKTLEEVKKILGTEKVFETPTSFGVNVFGKYQPNTTFIIRKDFEGNPLAYRSDAPVKSMLDNMNVDFDGGVGVIFGDFWKSQKGGTCFRPKPIANAQHVLIECSWGGAFSRTRGIGNVGGELYYRCAASNGGGAGNDYLIVPIGFYRVVRDAEIDSDSPSAAPDFTERAKAIREQFARFEREQAEKADREAKAKAEAEATSKAAKATGLGTRLDAVNVRLTMIGHTDLIKLGEVSFRWNTISMWEIGYSEDKIRWVEEKVTQLENEKAEQKRKRLAREAFQQKFEAFKPRIEALGITIEFTNDNVRLAGDYYGYLYSDDGLLKFVADLDRREREAAEAKAKADAEIAYQQRKTEAVTLGLPTDIRIWCRRGGRTNAGDGWVIGPNGQDRGNTAWYNPRPRHTSEGDKIWEQILKGEVVLQWAKGSSAAPHEFTVVHMPAEGLTEAQLERIREIQDELEREWEGARGLASGLPSPSIGDGWGLIPAVIPVAKGGERASANQLEALRGHFGK